MDVSGCKFLLILDETTGVMICRVYWGYTSHIYNSGFPPLTAGFSQDETSPYRCLSLHPKKDPFRDRTGLRPPVVLERHCLCCSAAQFVRIFTNTLPWMSFRVTSTNRPSLSLDFVEFFRRGNSKGHGSEWMPKCQIHDPSGKKKDDDGR